MTKEQRQALNDRLDDLDRRLKNHLDHTEAGNAVTVAGLTLSLVKVRTNVVPSGSEFVRVEGGDWDGYLEMGVTDDPESGRHLHGDFHAWVNGVSVDDALTLLEAEAQDAIDAALQAREDKVQDRLQKLGI